MSVPAHGGELGPPVSPKKTCSPSRPGEKRIKTVKFSKGRAGHTTSTSIFSWDLEEAPVCWTGEFTEPKCRPQGPRARIRQRCNRRLDLRPLAQGSSAKVTVRHLWLAGSRAWGCGLCTLQVPPPLPAPAPALPGAVNGNATHPVAQARHFPFFSQPMPQILPLFLPAEGLWGPPLSTKGTASCQHPGSHQLSPLSRHSQRPV